MNSQNNMSFIGSKKEYGTTWYYGKVGPMDHAIARGKERKHKFFVRRETEKGICYASYPDLYKYAANIGTRNENCYELVIKDTACKPYFDIEWMDHEIPGGVTVFNKVCLDIMDRFEEDFGIRISWDDLMVSKARGIVGGQTKWSFHVVIDCKVAFRNNKELGLWVKSRFSKPVDTSVYNNNANMRLLYQSKYQSERILLPVKHTLPRHSITHFEEPNPVFMDIGKLGLAPAEKEPSEKKTSEHTAMNEDSLLTEEQVEQVQKVLFEYGDTTSKITSVEKSNCYVVTQGERTCPFGQTHVHNNFYLNVADNGGVFYKCISSECKHQKAKKIGKIDFANKTPTEIEHVPQHILHEITRPTESLSQVEIEEYEEKYCLPLDKWVDQGIRHIILNSHLGTGKSTTIKRLVEKTKPKSVLVLTPRILYAKNNHASLLEVLPKLKYYKETPKDQRIAEKYIVCSMESLWTVDSDFELVIMDESESLLNQLSSFTMAKFPECVAKFENIMRSPTLKHVLWADAFMQDRTVQTAKNMELLRREGQMILPQSKESIVYIHNTYQPYDRVAHNVGSSSKDFVRYLEKHVKDYPERRLVIVSASKKCVLESEAVIRRANPSGRVLSIHSDTDSSLKNRMSDVNTLWKEYDYVLYTTSITVGISFDDKEYFDDLFIYFSAVGAPVRDLMQGSLRARGIKYNSLYYAGYPKYIGDYRYHIFERSDLYDDMNRILERRRNVLKKHGEDDGSFFTKVTNRDTLPMWLRDVWVFNEQEANTSALYHEDVVTEYLKICGYKEGVSYYVKAPEDTNWDFEKAMTKLDAQHGPGFEDIQEISKNEEQEYMEYLQNGTITEAQRYKLKKYHFMKDIVKEGTPLEETKRMFNAYCNRSDAIQRRITQGQEEAMGHVFEISTVFSGIDNAVRLQAIQEIAKALGLKHTQDIGQVITKEVFDFAAEKVMAMKQDLQEMFRLRDKEKKEEKKRAVTVTEQGHDLLNSVLARWGFTCIVRHKRKMKGPRGNQVNVAPYEVVANDEKEDPEDPTAGPYELFAKYGERQTRSEYKKQRKTE